MTSSRRPALLSGLSCLIFFSASCADDPAGSSGTGGGGTSGQSFYDGAESAALGAAGNEARCSTCHTSDGSIDGFSGHTMKDIAFRASFKGGEASELLMAVNACVTGWMGGQALGAEDERYVALRAYLESISDPSVTSANALSPEVLSDEAAYEAAYVGGDATAGAAKFSAVCGRCHAAALRVGGSNAPALPSLSTLSAGRIAQKVRTSGPPPSGMSDTVDTTPGPMPFFEPAELQPDDLADIIAYVRGG